MVYEESDKEELENIDHDDDLKSLENIALDDVAPVYEEEGYEPGDIVEPSSKGKGKHSDHESLKARRALEEHFANKRLRKELDYLYDDNFLEKENDDDES